MPALYTWPPHSHRLNSAPAATAVHVSGSPAHRAGARRSSSGGAAPFGAPLRGAAGSLPTPSWPCLLLPHASAEPSAMAKRVCERPQLADAAAPGRRTRAGPWRWRVSPRPSWPHSLRPQEKARPSAATATQCEAAGPAHTAVTRTPERAPPRRCGTGRLGRESSFLLARPMAPQSVAPHTTTSPDASSAAADLPLSSAIAP
mmetsp:Transcript_637/g.2108  ORF Transcript_637/g.2108 Transcript_637/m.2108 type:complete len:202 (+) Transcript_637:770-1375(+)